MANIKISELTPKGANLASTDLLEISESAGGGTYVTKSITGAQIIGAAGTATWGGITGTLSSQTDLQSALNAKQNTLTLTTTGTSGAATLVGSTLNIPQYSGGGGSGLVGIHNIFNNFTATGSGVDAAITSTASTNLSLTSVNQVIAYPFIPNKTITSSQLRINISTGGAGLSRILIYSDNNGFPNTKLFESADINIASPGIKSVTTTFTFNAGTTYWLAYHTNLAHSITAIATGALIPLIVTNAGATTSVAYFSAATFGSAPNTYVYSSVSATAVPRIMIVP